MTPNLPLPDQWHWSDYDKPTIRSDDNSSGMDGTLHEKFRQWGAVPFAARWSFLVRRMQLRQITPDGLAYRDALAECSTSDQSSIEAHVDDIANSLVCHQGVIQDLLNVLIQIEESHANRTQPTAL